jgi:hypothetical protein
MGKSGKILSFGSVSEFLILLMVSFNDEGWVELVERYKEA